MRRRRLCELALADFGRFGGRHSHARRKQTSLRQSTLDAFDQDIKRSLKKFESFKACMQCKWMRNARACVRAPCEHLPLLYLISWKSSPPAAGRLGLWSTSLEQSSVRRALRLHQKGQSARADGDMKFRPQREPNGLHLQVRLERWPAG